MAGWGAHPVCFAGAQEALDWLDNGTDDTPVPDIINSDFQMPGMDGEAFAREVRARPGHATTPIVMLSSVSEHQSETSRADLSLTPWLVKPTRGAVLAQRLIEGLIGAGPFGAHQDGATSRREDKISRPTDSVPTVTFGDRLRVLIDEDNVVNQLVISNMLRDQPVEIELAENGDVAFQKYRELSPDLVIMDVSMPVMDGLDAAAMIRAHELAKGLPRTPIIGATAHAMEEDRQRCMEAGMDDYMTKPIRKDIIVGMLRKWSRREREYLNERRRA